MYTDIYIQVKKLRMIESRYTNILNSLVLQQTELGSIQMGIEEQDLFSNIKKAIENEKKGLASANKEMKAMQTGLLSIASLYEEYEKNICEKIGNNVFSTLGSASKFKINEKQSINVGSANSETSSRSIWIDKVNELLDSGMTGEIEGLGVTTSFLKGFDAFNKEGAENFQNMTSYAEDFVNFFTGDKKGITGASDWCKLANSSIDIWKGLYDKFKNVYSAPTGFFGEIAQKKVAVLGLASGCLGLIGSITAASSGFDQKKWGDKVADYVDCGKDLFTTINAGYELKHLCDVNSLANIKIGAISALNIYSSIEKAGVSTISQGFRSFEKYSTDGEWSIGDTGALGIDMSTAGIYSLGHNLTWGLDDAVYGVIDKATGGSGNDDMSYAEKAAEGYKYLASECGKAIGNWWVALSK